ncbi:hypothetical protein KUTeg_021675 [Tegillarca granosa]|uniref:Uncharacterized protein n=1 Tax=Tegillarca granosa TaxID=220873 RepID=A0ABQ9E3Z6_TEGGR|nr:hypothetical protein KUTeg_021675 [Tegillarca granosa]
MMSKCCIKGAKCRTPLGMESLKIPDSAITASSSFEDKSVGPKSASNATVSNWFQLPLHETQMDLSICTEIFIFRIMSVIDICFRKEFAHKICILTFYLLKVDCRIKIFVSGPGLLLFCIMFRQLLATISIDIVLIWFVLSKKKS